MLDYEAMYFQLAADVPPLIVPRIKLVMAEFKQV